MHRPRTLPLPPRAAPKMPYQYEAPNHTSPSATDQLVKSLKKTPKKLPNALPKSPSTTDAYIGTLRRKRVSESPEKEPKK